MARIRSIKPGFFTSEDVSALPLSARLTWIGLWTHCDDHGRTKDNAKLIKAAIWPLDDVNLRDVEADLSALVEAGRIVRYLGDDGKPYLAVVNWHAHQAIAKPTAPRYPAPPVSVNPTSGCHACTTGGLPEESGSGARGKGGEGKGREGTRTRPPRRCPEHAHTLNPPACGACAEARKTHDSWPAAAVTPDPCPDHPDQLARDCRPCLDAVVPAAVGAALVKSAIRRGPPRDPEVSSLADGFAGLRIGVG